MGSGSHPWRSKHPVRAQIVVTLTCGCRTKTRLMPLPNATMGCSSGLAHGYDLRWTKAVDNGKTFTNTWLEEGR